MLPRDEIAALIPHAGSMCLLERVIEWDDNGIVLETATHRAADNPLRSNGRLRAIHLCEYGAQAMAVHGALRAQAHDGRVSPGLLVSLRAIELHCDFVDQFPHDLRVEATCVHADPASLQYDFRVLHDGQLLASGRAMVVLKAM
jgi:predicted hotdog family 3-hydroxylacyl-ACP dehydratase